ncbi:MAG: poly-gamma-glutamate synthase PgsB [Candidatus Cloacimonadota bacterium]|nr:poly-gamma-glutamate synthase PgsB [Candidatus Cloacimonadota bacterium]
MLVLFIFFTTLILYSLFEYHRHQRYRKQIPKIIHVNGTRGKSSVTRLIASGLRAGGLKIVAKTTGSAPRIILENGNEIPIARFFGANIKEQLKIVEFASKRNIDVLVLECMAVTPEYQWITEQKMLHSEVGVITNIRLDHLDLMGPGMKNVTYSICNTIPTNSTAFTSEKKLFPVMEKIAKKRNTTIHYCNPNEIANEDIEDFPFIEHKENVSLSLDVCENCGIDRKIALSAMKKTNPDIGATRIYNMNINGKIIYFVHSFAANDPESTKYIVDYIKNLHPNIDHFGLVLNTRADRMYRSKQLIQMLTDVAFDRLFLIGEESSSIKSFALRHKIDGNKIEEMGWTRGDELMSKVNQLEDKTVLLIGIGNIGGNGGMIVDYFKEQHRKTL